MENVAEALKIAFAALLFVLALTLSMSSFSQATRAVNAITTIKDKESQYTYVEPTEGLSRTVGIETVVSTIYQAYEHNIEIHFFDDITGKEIPIFYKFDPSTGEAKRDSTNLRIELSCIDTKTQSFGGVAEYIEFVDVLLGGKELASQRLIWDKYKDRIKYKGGLYNEFADSKFEELLGEYEDGTGTSKTTRRIITFIKK